MNESLMETVGRRELAPITHRVTDITTRAPAGRGDNGIPVHTETVRARTFVFLFRINGEVPPRRRFLRQPNRTSDCHQTSITFQHINILLREGNLHVDLGRVVRLVGSDMVVPAAGSDRPASRTSGQD